MGQSLEHVFRTVDRDDRVKVVVLTGAGKTFCAGADLDIGFSGAGKITPEEYRDRYETLVYTTKLFKCGLTKTVVVASPWPSTAAANPPSSPSRAQLSASA